ncbi:MAG: LptF/LptG family permease, partial [Pseudomonadota bacterium]
MSRQRGFTLLEVLGALILLVDIIEQARRYGGMDVSFGQRLELTLLNIPTTINQILPLIMILATIA